MWAACLRARSGQTFAAKRLGADNRADLIAVYVNISGVHPIADKLRRLINSAVDAEGQPITARIDLLAHAIEAIALKAHDVQDRSKYFALQGIHGFDAEDMGRKEY